MPELPEVETTRRGIEPHLVGQRVRKIVVRDRRLRWPIPESFEPSIVGKTIEGVGRRAKYLVVDVGDGHFLIHLGMSGSLRVLMDELEPDAHDHVDVILDNGTTLRYNDPRRFGSMHWVDGDPAEHWLLAELGPEPLSDEFNAQWLRELAGRRKGPVKNFIMQQSVVVGVGNIYASEALYIAGIHPTRPAGRVSLQRYETLVEAIKMTLAAAIEVGGTTLRDFVDANGAPGYFSQKLKVYGREGEPCDQCGSSIRKRVIGQRSSFFCGRCQR